MPPRYAYWTILVDEQPTAFRAGDRDDLQPTFKRLKAKHASARLVWFQNGKIWNSRLDAQEAMHARGEMGRRGDVRQRGGFRDRQREQRDSRLEWHPKGPAPNEKLEWAPKAAQPSQKLGWTPKGKDSRRKHSQRPPTATPRAAKLEWAPKQAVAGAPREKRKWVPKEEYKKAQGIEAKRDNRWRPGGEHRDPRQKYKDAKKAKWGRFKQNIRKNWEAKQGRKKKDDE